MQLNRQAAVLCQQMLGATDRLRIEMHRCPSGARVVDCGVHATGGLEAGRIMAEVCLAGLGEVSFAASLDAPWPSPLVTVRTDQPLAACIASQYAGWRVDRDDYFAMASGPMRALAAKEPLFETVGPGVEESVAVGVLESPQLPPPSVCRYVAEQCHVATEDLILLVAPTASLAGTVQVVARSVETALHKLLEFGFDLTLVECGFGAAPLPPVAANDFSAMGRTNDAILYGAEVTLWVRAEQDQVDRLAERIPSLASPAHGTPFAEIFDRHGRDFYQVDPLLFGPAVVTLVNLQSGRTVRAGRLAPEVLRASFGTAR